MCALQTLSLHERHAAAHRESVGRVQTAVATFRSARRHFRVYHGSTSSTRTLDLQRDAIVDISDMTRIYAVDRTEKVVKCEPNVPMDALVEHTLRVGLIPKIAMEFKGITVGGGFSGMSGESSMFKYGLFQNIISEIEIVLGDGSLAIASRTQNQDLLEQAGGSLGTFGIITLLTVELMEAKKFVNLELTCIESVAKVVPSFETAITATPQPDYIDGIHYSPSRIIIMMVGYMANEAKQAPLKKMQVHWFSSEVERKAGTMPVQLTLTLEDYVFRYDHGVFWGGALAFEHYHIPNIYPFRVLADPFLDSRTCYRALHKTGLAAEYVVQDFGVPASSVGAFVSYVQKVLPKCGLFFCPALSIDEVGITSRLNPLAENVRHERMYGVGVYGRGPKDAEAFQQLNRKLERKATELLASKLLYARTYFPKDEFWKIYNQQSYNTMRLKYKAVTTDEKGEEFGLPDVFEKLAADMRSPSKRRSVRGLVTVMRDRVLGRTEYLLPKQ